MDEEAARARVRKMKQKAAANLRAIPLSITASLVIMLILLWMIHSRFELPMEPSRYNNYTDWAFYVGVVTMLFGIIFLILAIPILTDLFLNFSEQLQDKTGIYQAKETKMKSKAIATLFVTVITMLMLLWAIHTGFRLATESKRDNKYYLLTISVGVVTIIFGSIYFLIGLAIFMELTRDLLGHLQWKEKEGTGIPQGHNIEAEGSN